MGSNDEAGWVRRLLPASRNINSPIIFNTVDRFSTPEISKKGHEPVK